MAADLPREQQVAPLVIARRPIAYDLQLRTVDAYAVALLNKQAAGNRAQFMAGRRSAIVRRGENPQLLLRRENLQRRRHIAGRNQKLDELFV